MMKHDRSTTSELGALSAFAGAPLATLELLAAHTDRLHLAPGAVLAREGRRAREFIVILSGDVAVMRAGRQIDQYTTGAQIGGRELVGDGAHEHTIVAGGELEVLVVNGPAYRWAVRTDSGHLAA